MCIRDRYQRRVRGIVPNGMGGFVSRVGSLLSVLMSVPSSQEDMSEDELDQHDDMFYVENNYIFTPLVKQALKTRGWHPVPSSVSTGVREATSSDKEFAKKIVRYCDFLWIRWRTTIPFADLDCDRHIVNHISNEHILTIKSKLCKMMTNVNQSTGLVLHPETFIMADLVADPELAARVCAIPEVMWIIKPAVGSAGRDIHIASSGEVLMAEVLQSKAEGARRALAEQDAEEIFIVQRYIMNPLVLPGPSGRGHKFDMRIYFFIASASPMISFMYNDGYLRVNAEPYDLSDTDNLQAHITNFHVSKAHPQYDRLKDAVDGMSVRWTFGELAAHLQQHFGHMCGEEPVIEHVKAQIREILGHVSAQVKGELDPRPGCFALLGVDIMLDSELKAWLIEFTKNPALRKNTPHLAELHTGLVQEICDVAVELRESRINQQPLTPELQSLKNFTLVCSEV
eukprot:TRINITY_DN15682_c0_g1_i2.p1 TRINITY_DN15682_c0_g1~~TRINITY_DN15682_c0_g1_i2.p1  ORF type:complete len:455 (-),score=153.17 TRINITY_DN15682_c0_g1_i2:195-1559(-)